MAILNGTDYDHVDLQNNLLGGDITRHMLKDAQARQDVANLQSANQTLNNRINSMGVPIDTQHNYSPTIPAINPNTEGANDLDLYKEPGTYRVTTAAIAKSISNCPAKVGGRLIAMNISDASNKLQVYLANNGKTFTRKCTINNGVDAWTDWQELATGDDVASEIANATSELSTRIDAVESAVTESGNRIDAMGIPIDTKQNYSPIIPALIPGTEDQNDFDLYMSPGTYRVTTVAIATAILHHPTDKGGRLIVMNLNESNSKLQVYLATDGNIFIRKGTTASGYSATWSVLATANDVATIASVFEPRIGSLETNVTALGTPIDTRHNYAPTIPATIPDTENEPNDLNLYTTPGTYRVTTAAIASALVNCPAGVGGRLITMNLSDADSKLQVYLANNGNVFTRKGTINSDVVTWTAWAAMATSADVAGVSSSINASINALGTPFSTSQAYNTVVQADDNLNNYTTPGNYRVPTIAVAKTLVNAPTKKAGRLTVINTSENAAKMQTYFANDGIYFRTGTTTKGYGDWVKIATMADIPDESEEEEGEEEEEEDTGFVIDPVKIRGTYNLLDAMRKQTPYNIAYANALTPLPLKNYIGNTENVHPKVLYFANGFGGHNYWMAYTPYPASNDDYENPCIAYSDDGYEWTDYAQNPLDTPSDLKNTYNSDTHLVYREDTGVLECWYRFVDETGDDSSQYREVIYRRTTTDGVNWTAREVVTEHTGPVTRYLSPAVIWDNTNKVYHIWAVHGSTYDNRSPKKAGISYFTASVNDISNWVWVRDYPLTFTDDGMAVNSWHMDCIKEDVGGETKYIMLVMCRNGQYITNNRCSLFITTSDDNIEYDIPVKVLGGADNWDRFMYRSCIVKVDGKFRIYYSSSSGGPKYIYGSTSKWGMGITETLTDTLGNFYGRFE